MPFSVKYMPLIIMMNIQHMARQFENGIFASIGSQAYVYITTVCPESVEQ